jgi:hypothetical protein
MVNGQAAIWLIRTTILMACASAVAAGRPSAVHNPQSHEIEARNGDTVAVDGNARVKIVRRRTAHVRTVFNSEQHWLVLIAQYTPEDGGTVHNAVDDAFLFRDVVGVWPVAERWEGNATIETYFMATESGGAIGFGVQLPSGLIQLFTRRDPQGFGTSVAAAVLSYRGIAKAPLAVRPSMRSNARESPKPVANRRSILVWRRASQA